MNDLIFDIETNGLEPINHEIKDKESGRMLKIDACVVTGIGLQDEEIHTWVGKDEKEILDKFWNKYSNGHRLIGFNVKEFDIPFLLTRSMANGCKMTSIGSYKDMRIILGFGRWRPRGKIEDWCEALGINLPSDDFKGEDMPRLYEEGRFDEIQKHLRYDLARTKAVYDKCKGAGLIE